MTNQPSDPAADKKKTTRVIPIPAPDTTQPPARRSAKPTIHIIRIDLDEALTAQQPPAQDAPPAAPAAHEPATIQLKRPPTAPITIKPDSQIPISPTKIQTRRVETAAADAAVEKSKYSTSSITVIPQTFRLKRASAMSAAFPPAATISEAPTVMRSPTSKRSTARILVDETPPQPAASKTQTAPIATTPEPPGTPKPRTIQLKRSVPAPSLADTSAIVAQAKKAETAKIDLIQEAEIPPPLTQRKTIKIKRSEQHAVPQTVKLKRPEAAPAATPARAELIIRGAPKARVELDDPWLLGLAAASALLIGCLVYIMAAQAFGPELILPLPAALL